MSTSPLQHPYYPLDAPISGYVSNEASVLRLLIQAGACCILLLTPVLVLVSYWSPSLGRADRLAILWFVLCTRDPIRKTSVIFKFKKLIDF